MKILQIIPAPEFMRGEYRRQDVYDEIYPIECRIACLALVEDDDGQREIKPVPYDCDDPYGILEPESPFRWLCEGEHLTESEE